MDWASELASHTVAAQLKGLAGSEGGAAEPMPGGGGEKKPKPKPEALKPKPRKPDAGGTPATRDGAAEDADEDEQEEGRGTGAILPEDDADAEADADAEGDEPGADDGEDGESDDDGVDDKGADQDTQKKLKALEKDNFSTRQKLRESKAELRAREERIAALEKQVSEKGGGAGGVGANGLPAGFEHVKGAADLDAMEAQFQRAMDWAEDNAEGWTGKGEDGAEVEYTPQQIRQYRRQMQAGLKRVGEARGMLQKRGEREKAATDLAKVKYPFVMDASSPHAALVKRIGEEHPEVRQSPESALLLGRLAVARLIEDGTYEITRKAAKPKGKTAEGKRDARPTSTSHTPPSPPPARRRTGDADAAAGGDDWALNLARASMPGAA